MIIFNCLGNVIGFGGNCDVSLLEWMLVFFKRYGVWFFERWMKLKHITCGCKGKWGEFKKETVIKEHNKQYNGAMHKRNKMLGWNCTNKERWNWLSTSTWWCSVFLRFYWEDHRSYRVYLRHWIGLFVLVLAKMMKPLQVFSVQF